ncbi:MAG: hypothetical protein KHW60_02610 [Oscillibacter sp.]|nr:hypothetical protein [Oscillibacter sp.]
MGHQQGGPDHGDVEEQSKYDVVDFMGLFQMMTTSSKSEMARRAVIDSATGPVLY